LKVLILLAILIGVIARIANIDQKAYWYDEAFTSLELSGHNPDEARTDILTGRVVGIRDLQRYQYPDPASGKTVKDTVTNLLHIEPQLTPLYFIVARWWVELFGPSVAAIRSLSVAFSLAVLPLAFWLSKEIFQSSRVAWTAVALFSVSPFHVLYAQEARPYSMWIALIILNCAVALWAARSQRIAPWLVYFLVAVASLYCYLVSILVIGGLVLYVFLSEHCRLSRTTLSCAGASIGAVLAFLPWPHSGIQSGSGIGRLSAAEFTIRWVRSITLFFVDLDVSPAARKQYLFPYGGLLLVVLAIIGYAIYFLMRRSDQRARLFLVVLTSLTGLCFVGLDLVSGSSKSTVTRYVIPSFLGIQIAVAYLVSNSPTSDLSQTASRLRTAAAVFLMCLGVISSAKIQLSPAWWTKAPDNSNLSAAAIINGARDPIVVSDAWFVRILSLEHGLNPGVRFDLVTDAKQAQIKRLSGSVFLFAPSSALRSEVPSYCRIVLADPASDLWRVDRGPEARIRKNEWHGK
jgi:uncharacterized membrane protein